MQRLVLFRHGKSAWPAGIADFDRPLGPRGEIAVPMMARWLAGMLAPDLALVSPARRTRETFALIAPAFPNLSMRSVAEIYEADFRRLTGILHALPRTVSSVMIVGHNPGMSELALTLSGGLADDADARSRLRSKYPTSGIAILDIEMAWRDLVPGCARLAAFQTPAMLGGLDED